MKLATIVITLFLIGGFVSGIGGFYSALMSQYGTADSSSLSATMNTTTRTQEMMSTLTGNLSQNQSTTGGTITSDAPTNLITNAFTAGNLLMNSPAIFMSIITDLTSIAGVPSWVSVMLYGIISVIIIFAVIEFITGRQTQE